MQATPTVNTPAALRRNRWGVTLRNALTITRREVIDSFRDWRILAPIVVLTLVFPFLAQLVASRFAGFVTQYGAQIIGERTIPFLLMIVGFFPISISLVIALETFVGEKERRSLEPLLSTPLTNTELYIGKTLAAMIPPLLSSYGGMALYLGTLLLGELAWRPQPMLIVQIVLLTTVQALVMVTGAVVVSSQTTSTRAANLLASFIIIPMTLIIQLESFIMFIAPDADSPRGVFSLWLIIGAMLVGVVLLLRVGSSLFNREELLGRSIDVLNIGGVARGLWRSIIAVDAAGTPARDLGQWLARGIPGALQRTRLALGVTALWFALAFVLGMWIAAQPAFRLVLPPPTSIAAQSSTLDALLSATSGGQAAQFILWQNGRVLLLAFVLGLFSFGAGALVLTPAAFVLLGYAAGVFAHSGWGLGLLAAAVVPHGLVEVPIVILAVALALRAGAAVTRPPAGKTVGAGWMQALGDAVKLAVALVLPGLALAALLEAFVTPQVLLRALGVG